MKDGWHVFRGAFKILVENGRVVRAVKPDYNGYPVSAAPYKRCRLGGWDNACGVKYATFVRGYRAGRYAIF